MVRELSGMELALYLPYFRQSVAWAMLLLALAQAGGYDIRAYWDWYTCKYSTQEEIDEVRRYTHLPSEDTMTDLERLQAIAALEQIVDAADQEREEMEAYLAALKQQAEYAKNTIEYQAQIERSKTQCHQ